jgi:hypothetical protein
VDQLSGEGRGDAGCVRERRGARWMLADDGSEFDALILKKLPPRAPFGPSVTFTLGTPRRGTGTVLMLDCCFVLS